MSLRPRLLLHTLLLATALLMPGSPIAAQTWQQVACDQRSVSASGDIVHSVGLYGSILRSSDGGSTWTQPQSHTRQHLRAVRHANPELAVAVGDSGVIRRTTDAGRTWCVVPFGHADDLRDIDMFDVDHWILVGRNGMVATSVNGATSFETDTSNVTEHLSAVDLVDPRYAVAISEAGSFYVSMNFRAWNRNATGVSTPLRAVYFRSRGVGFVGGDNGVLLATRSGGAAWDHRNGHGLIVIHSIDAHVEGVVTVSGLGLDGHSMSRSTDDGLTWSRVGADIPAHDMNVVHDVHFRTPSHGFAVGQPALVATTSDGGEQWRVRSHAPLRATIGILPMTSAGFPSKTTAVIAGGVHPTSHMRSIPYLRTADGGTTWRGDVIAHDDWISTLHFFDSLEGLALSRYGTFFHSSDGGATWSYSFNHSISPPPSNGSYRLMTFIDDRVGFLSGGSSLYRTTDRGGHWTPVASGFGSQPGSLHFLDHRHGFARARGKVYASADAGDTWTNIFTNPDGVGGVVRFFDLRSGTMVGGNGILFRTFDAGITWDTFDTGHRVHLNDFVVVNSRIGYIIAAKGPFLLKTTDAGRTWEREYPWQPETFADHAALEPYYIDKAPDGRTVYLFGNGGILRGVFDEPFSAVDVDAATPPSGANASVLTVWPNPVDKSLRVHVEIDARLSPRARLTLIDLLGREVRDLTDQLRSTLARQAISLAGMHAGTYVMRYHDGDIIGTAMITLR